MVLSSAYYTQVMRSANSSTPMRVGLYCRVSNDPSGRGTSVADQEKEGRRWCATNGHIISWVVVDNDLSASRHSKRDRPGYAQVQQNLAGAAPVDILWAWESSRFQRDMEAYVRVRALCERYEVLWSYHGRTYDMSRTDDRFSTGMDALLAERYSDETRDRVLRAVRSRVESGRPHGRVPYGYRTVRDEFTGRTIAWEIDPEAAPVIREIVRRSLGGEPRIAIARDLNQRGVPSPHKLRAQRAGKDSEKTRTWWIDTITRILVSPSIAGIRTHMGVVVEADATWPAIITVDTHQALKRLVEQTQLDPTRDRKVKYLLTGIARCGVCGSRCRRVANKRTAVYACWGGGTGHYCVARQQHLVDAVVVDALMARVASPHFLESFQRDDRGELAEARQELAALVAKLEEFREASMRPDGIPVAMLARAEAKYGPLIEAARQRATPVNVPPLLRDLAEAADTYQQWLGYSANQQRQVIKMLMTVTINPVDNHGSIIFDPTKIEIKF